MKIKRFNNLWTMGLILSAVILGAIYLLKIFLPQFVIEVAHIDSIVQIGHYIDTHQWAWYLASTVLSIISYFLICCACCGRKNFAIKEWVIILCTILILFIVKEFLPSQYTVLNCLSQILLPFLFNGNFKNTVIVFGAINLLQTMTLEIRNLSSMIIDFNFATFTILMIDVYILEFLFYCAFNYNEGDIENGTS